MNLSTLKLFDFCMGSSQLPQIINKKFRIKQCLILSIQNQNIQQEVKMIEFLFLTIPGNLTYQDLKNPIVFSQDKHGFSCWAFKQSLTIYSADLTQKHVFQDGRVQVLKVNNVNLEQKWKYFVMTKSNGARVYCTSHVFYEKCPIQIQENSLFNLTGPSFSYTEFYLPKCLVISSAKPYFKMQTNLIKIYHELRKNNPSICESITQSHLDNFQNQLFLKQQNKVYNSTPQHKRNNMSTSTITIKSSKSIKNKKLFNSTQLLFNYYVSMCNNHNFGQKLLICPQNKLQILHLYNISQSLYRLNYFFHIPISINNLITIISAVLQQKQIIFTSSNQNSNLMLMQTILEMLNPLKWQFMYVPNLPYSMLDAAEESFMPYMVGIHKKYLDRITKTGRVIVYVDKDCIQVSEPIIQLPTMLKQILLLHQTGLGNLQYLDWQKYMRIKSILMLSALINQQNYWQFTDPKSSSYQFYQYFFRHSAIFNNYKSELFKQANIQLGQLLNLTFQEKINLIQGKFRQLLMQAAYPTICNNDRQWIKYYYENIEQNKKSLKNLNIRSSYVFSKQASTLLRQSLVGTSTEISQANVPNNQIKMRKSMFAKKGIGFVLSTIKI